MCDIWKGNKSVKQLDQTVIENLLKSLIKLKTQWVVMSGGEALMHPNFFRFCQILKSIRVKITVLSTGLMLEKYALKLVEKTDDLIISLDGSQTVHDAIRGISGAYDKLKTGVQAVKKIDPQFSVSGRSVIQQANFHDWSNIVDASHEIGLDHISFLPADISTSAFNRPKLWSGERKKLLSTHKNDFRSGYILESEEKLRKIHTYYAAFHGLAEFPEVRCNAPWVSSVIESDGSVQPCFFHPSIGSLSDDSFETIINNQTSITFRKNLNIKTDPICKKCVCSLNLSPLKKVI
jgi:MoaA/NifB/PqqE/SkfB family radical SAM enzyme